MSIQSVSGGGRPDHEAWDELAAADALHALDAENAARYAEHARSCLICRREGISWNLTAAALAELAVEEAPPPGLRDRILSSLPADPAVPTSRRDTASAASRLVGRPARWLVAAALVLIVGVGGFATWRSFSGPGHTPLCASADCSAATLTAAGTGQVLAKVAVGTQTFVDAVALSRNDRRNSIYVLWRVRGKQATAIGTFDVPARGDTVRVTTSLTSVPLGDQLAVSRESGRIAPAAPSTVLAAGAVRQS